MAEVSFSAFLIVDEWDTVGLLRDNIFELLCLNPTAPDCHLLASAPTGATTSTNDSQVQ